MRATLRWVALIKQNSISITFIRDQMMAWLSGLYTALCLQFHNALIYILSSLPFVEWGADRRYLHVVEWERNQSVRDLIRGGCWNPRGLGDEILSRSSKHYGGTISTFPHRLLIPYTTSVMVLGFRSLDSNFKAMATPRQQTSLRYSVHVLDVI